MAAVSTRNGLAYGVRATAVFAVILVVGVATTALGTTMVTTARTVSYFGSTSTDWVQLGLGVVLSLGGGLALSAGSMGLLYKVIADGVRRGNSRTA
jgi:hypothetical protein